MYYYRANEAVNEAIEEQPSVADDSDDDTSTDVAITPSPYYYDGSVEQENDRQVLTSILTEGRYDISSEDRSILEIIVLTLQ